MFISACPLRQPLFLSYARCMSTVPYVQHLRPSRDLSSCKPLGSVKDVWNKSRVTRNGRDLTTKWEQPWPQLVCCASIYCHVCGCIFQEDGIVARSFGEKWYRLIGVRIEQGEDVNDFNL